ncbi:MAG: guanylate kinase, partial [Thermoguttaceae bacterium]
PPSIEELRRRLEGRGSESREEIDKRMAQAQAEIDSSDFYQYRVVNDELDGALNELIDVLKKGSRTN